MIISSTSQKLLLLGLLNSATNSLSWSDEKIINLVKFENCIVYGADARTYSLIHVDASKGKGKIENIEFSKIRKMFSVQ